MYNYYIYNVQLHTLLYLHPITNTVGQKSTRSSFQSSSAKLRKSFETTKFIFVFFAFTHKLSIKSRQICRSAGICLVTRPLHPLHQT